MALAAASSPVTHATQWPKVEEVHKSYIFSNVANAGFDLELRERNGERRAVYMLKCHSGVYEADSDFNYSGLIDCRLVSLYSKEAVSSLLSETAKQTSDWHDRGRFLATHLRKGCAAYPDWGQRRTFRLRGMKITIEISNIMPRSLLSEGGDKVQSYSVDIAVRPDPTADTPLTQEPRAPQPPWFYDASRPCDRTP